MILHLYMALALTILNKQVHSEETPVFVLKGQDVRLELKENVDPKHVSVVLWRFNDSYSIVTYFPSVEDPVVEKYKNKASFSKENFSLLIKSLQEADSGSYSVKVTREGAGDIQASYSVVVQDKVDPPVLKLDCNNFTADSCNMTVTCRTLHTSVSSTCNSITCSQVGGDTGGVMTSTAPLLIYVSGGSIICNHSNQVSWAKDTMNINELCPFHPPGKPIAVIIAITTPLVLIVVVSICVYVYKTHKKKTRTETINSTYDTVQNTPSAQGASGQTADSNSPSIYSMVQHLPRPEEPETMEVTGNSVYAQVKKQPIRR